MCQIQTTIETVGARLYLANLPFAAKDKAKSIGCKWDADRRQWWAGKAKKAELERLVASLSGSGDSQGQAGSDQQQGEPDTAKVYAKIEYKGKTYYQTASSRDQQKIRLATLDGKLAFWADRTACTVLKEYAPRKSGSGRYEREEYQTLGGLRRFTERAKEGRKSGQICCVCGKPASQLHRDLEDGMMKHYRCCDMPE